jgi:hypothetical protein
MVTTRAPVSPSNTALPLTCDLDDRMGTLRTAADEFLVTLMIIFSAFERMVVLAPACPIILGIVLASLLGSGWPRSRSGGYAESPQEVHAKGIGG